MFVPAETIALLKHFGGITTHSEFTFGQLEVRDEDGVIIAVCDVACTDSLPARVSVIKPRIEGKYLCFDAGLDGRLWGNRAIIRDVRVEHDFELVAFANALMRAAQRPTFNTRGVLDLMLTPYGMRIGVDYVVWIGTPISSIEMGSFVHHIVVHCPEDRVISDGLLQLTFGHVPKMRYVAPDAEVIFGTEVLEEIQVKILTILGH